MTSRIITSTAMTRLIVLFIPTSPLVLDRMQHSARVGTRQGGRPAGGRADHKVSDLVLGRLLPRELALLGDQTVKPGEAGVTPRFISQGALGVDVPVEGLAVVAQSPVQLAHEVGGDGELPSVESLLSQGADKVAEGPELEGALEGVLALLAADPRGAQT